MSDQTSEGYAPVNGLDIYWQSRGSGGVPLVVVHGGYAVISTLDGLLDSLARDRRVVAVELQGHGHTADIDRPFTWEAFGDDLAALMGHLELGRADLLGYSLGAGACLRAAIQHPEAVRRLVVVSFPFRRDGWFPEVRANFDQMSHEGFQFMRHSPVYAAYAEVAPDPGGFPALMDKVGDLTRRDFDWADDVKAMTAQTMLVYGDADSIPTSHISDFYGLLGGGLADPGWDGSTRGGARLAILPGLTHYDICGSSQLRAVVADFLALP
ncbi:MAG TPA: alpha/beta hydrolase [Acidimicrobiales bacterium]|nr:alpha/beta hydrolase [Acidimicrobiales bacterium]